MVLWEIALGTAYFLGLKRTYKLSLQIQRRLISPNYPNIRQFLQRRTRTVFDATLKVHREIQKRDLEIGRNLGNWILRLLDKAKPAAQIRAGGPIQYANTTSSIPRKRLTEAWRQKTTNAGFRYLESRRRLVNSSRNLLLTRYPTVAKLLRRREPLMNNKIQFRQLVSSNSKSELGFGFNGVIRNDVIQWLNRA